MTPSAVDEAAPAILPDMNGHSNSELTDGVNGLAKQSGGSSMIPEPTSPGCLSTLSLSLGDLQTEQKNTKTTKVDAVSTLDLCRRFAFPSHVQSL